MHTNTQRLYVNPRLLCCGRAAGWLHLCAVCVRQGGDREETREIQGGVSQRYQEPVLPEHTAVLRSVWQPADGTHGLHTALIAHSEA